jgi:hypothetical protein
MGSKYLNAYVTALNQLTEEEGVSRFANTADFYDNGINGPGGQRTTIDTSTGKVKTSDASGTDVTSVQGTPISHTTPNLTGYAKKTYTGSAQGKGIASGGQKETYNSGPLDATRYQDPTGKQTSATTSYDLGVAKATVNQQGDENSPTQTTMQYTQPEAPDQPQTMEEEAALEEIRRLAFGKQELDEVGPQGYAGDDQAFAKYADNRAKGDMLAKDAADSGGVGVKSFVSPQAKAVTQDLTTGLAGNNPEMEKRYTMNKLTAPAPRDISGELEESELDAMRRIMNHRR